MPTDDDLPHHRPPRPSPTQIGNHKLKPQTLMLGYGFDPELSEGSLKPPIFLTSTFVFENAAAGKRFFEGVTGKRPGGAEGLIYSRFNGPNQEILEDRLAVWEEADDALAFSSGMAAIATLLMTFVQPGDVVVHSGPLYAATETLIAKIFGRFGVSWLDFPSGATREEIDAAIAQGKEKGRVSLIYLESPANPTNALVDVEAVVKGRERVVAQAGAYNTIVVNLYPKGKYSAYRGCVYISADSQRLPVIFKANLPVGEARAELASVSFASPSESPPIKLDSPTSEGANPLRSPPLTGASGGSGNGVAW